MTDNVHYLPNYEPEPELQPVTLRVTLVAPDAPPPPAITPLGAALAVLCGLASFVLVSALLAG